MGSLLEARNVTKTIFAAKAVTIVKDISLEIKAGEFTIITGPSGSGKSSLLYLLGLLDPPTEGEVYYCGEATSAYSEEGLSDLRLSHLGFVFQFHFLLPEFTALENVLLPMQRLGRLSDIEMNERATNLLLSFGLENELNKRPKQLSGGQSQRVAVARALSNDPKVILADEPTGNLDTQASQVVQDTLRELITSNERGVVVVTHDPSFAKAGDRLIRVVDGRLDADKYI